ncbi:hypothetical protein BVX99_01985 [bacterium F16]|nr:hypothetical protein BVX99_01985 [bacterium F16]
MITRSKRSTRIIFAIIIVLGSAFLLIIPFHNSISKSRNEGNETPMTLQGEIGCESYNTGTKKVPVSLKSAFFGDKIPDSISISLHNSERYNWQLVSKEDIESLYNAAGKGYEIRIRGCPAFPGFEGHFKIKSDNNQSYRLLAIRGKECEYIEYDGFYKVNPEFADKLRTFMETLSKKITQPANNQPKPTSK